MLLPETPSNPPPDSWLWRSGDYSCGGVSALWRVLSKIRKNPVLLQGGAWGACPFSGDHVSTEKWGQVVSFLLKGKQINAIEGTSSGFQSLNACGARELVNNTAGRVEAVAGTQLPTCKCSSNCGTTGGGPGLAEPLSFQVK